MRRVPVDESRTSGRERSERAASCAGLFVSSKPAGISPPSSPVRERVGHSRRRVERRLQRRHEVTFPAARDGGDGRRRRANDIHGDKRPVGCVVVQTLSESSKSRPSCRSRVLPCVDGEDSLAS